MSQAEYCQKHNRIFDANDETDNGLCPECRKERVMSATPPGDPVPVSPYQCPNCQGNGATADNSSGFSYTWPCYHCKETGVIWLPTPVLQAVQPSPLVWTREAPKTAGFYCRTHPSWVTCKSKFDVIEIYDHDIGRMPVKGFLWAGPIPEPEALPKEGA